MRPLNPGVPVIWLQATAAELPVDTAWLSGAERDALARLRFAKRRSEWLLGRWTAKRLILAGSTSLAPLAENLGVGDLAIVAAEDGAPEAQIEGRTLPIALSLTHRAGVAVAMIAPAELAPGRSVALGCDLELLEPRSAAFVRDYFTSEERAWISGAAGRDDDPFLRAALTWSAKESALKAARTGLRRDTRSVELCLPLVVGHGRASEPSWQPLRVRDHHLGRTCEGYWRRLTRHLLLTMVSHPAAEAAPGRSKD